MAKLKIAPEVFSVHLIVRFLYCHFSSGNYFEIQYHLATGQDILCVFIDSFGRFMCFIYFDKLVMHGVDYCSYCMKIRTC